MKTESSKQQFDENAFLSIFSNRRQAEKNLSSLLKDQHPAPGENFDRSFLHRLFFELKQYPDPDTAFNNLERLASALISRRSFLDNLSRFQPLVARLVKLFSISQYLADLLIRDSSLLSLLLQPAQSCRPPDREELISRFRKTLSQKPVRGAKFATLGRLKRFEIFKIAVGDFLLENDLRATTRSLSCLADAVLQMVCEIHFDEMSAKLGKPDAEFSIIALGKLGGGELNYSSDIDVLFVYDHEGSMKLSNTELTYHEFYQRLGENIVQSVSRETQDGRLYRIDTRLRPDGDSGPLAVSVGSALQYYASRGALWERQMLLKARVCAGDGICGMRFLEGVEHFVFPGSAFSSPIREIQEMKCQIEENQDTGSVNVKTGRGGIRDIEFVVQALQLVNGSRNPAIRSGHTLESLERLFEAGLIEKNEKTKLVGHYIFLRRIEHFLQIEENRQVHEIPTEQMPVKKLGFSCGFDDAGDFLENVSNSMAEVRTIFDSVFGGVEEDKDVQLKSLFRENLGEERIKAILAPYGFPDPVQMQKYLVYLARGHFPQRYGAETEARLLRILPKLLELVAATPSPGNTIVNLERSFSSYRFINSLYNVLADNENLIAAFVRIFSLNVVISKIFTKRSAYIDKAIIEFPNWMAGKEFYLTTQIPNSYDFKDFEMIRIMVQDLTAVRSIAETMKDLSLLAEVTVRAIYQKVVQQNKPAEGEGFAVVALGKFGGMELSYKSDLDVVFVCSDTSPVEEMIELARRLLNGVSAVTSDGVLYEMDARLRPEGQSAPLVVTESRYYEYLEKRASVWERLAVIRSRFVCGDERLGKRVVSRLWEFAYAPGFGRSDWEEIRQLRQKQIAKVTKIHKKGYQFDLKLSDGGLVDVEYLIQALQLRFGKGDAGVRTTSVLVAMEALQQREQLNLRWIDRFRDAYVFLRTIEKMQYLALDRKSNSLVTEPERKEYLARCLGFQDAGRLVNAIEDSRKIIRGAEFEMPESKD